MLAYKFLSPFSPFLSVFTFCVGDPFQNDPFAKQPPTATGMCSVLMHGGKLFCFLHSDLHGLQHHAGLQWHTSLFLIFSFQFSNSHTKLG